MGHRTTKLKSKIKVHKTIESKTDFFYYIFRNILLIGLPLTIISGLVLSHLSIRSSATDSSGVDRVTLSIPVSCTINTTVNNEHTISMISGTYKDNIGKTTMKTTCNDKNGFVIYAIGSTNDIDGNNKLSSIDLGENYDIPTGLNTSKPLEGEDVSNWAMKLTSVNGNYAPIIETAYDNTYGLIPNDWTKVASRNPGTFDMQEGSTFTTTYAIYLKGTQPAGTYTGQVKYALLHPASSISPTTLERAFFLAGKQKVDIYDDNDTNTTESTNPTTGEPNTLIGSYYKMQDITTSICDTANITGEASQVQLLDIRDNNIYWATKLLDGHCWMTQNLDLDLDSSVALTSEDTDLTDTTSAAYQDGYNVENNIISWTPASNASTIKFEGSTTSWPADGSTAYNKPYSADKTDSIGTGHSSLGNYYNWTAAIASNNSSSITLNTIDDTSKNPRNSICPRGWRLPIITNYSNYYAGNNDFANLNYYYNNGSTSSNAKLLSAPIYFTKSGYTRTNRLDTYSNWGLYQSSTLYNNSSVYYLYLTGGVSPAYRYGNYDRGWGYSIRCIAR